MEKKNSEFDGQSNLVRSNIQQVLVNINTIQRLRCLVFFFLEFVFFFEFGAVKYSASASQHQYYPASQVFCLFFEFFFYKTACRFFF